MNQSANNKWVKTSIESYIANIFPWFFYVYLPVTSSSNHHIKYVHKKAFCHIHIYRDRKTGHHGVPQSLRATHENPSFLITIDIPIARTDLAPPSLTASLQSPPPLPQRSTAGRLVCHRLQDVRTRQAALMPCPCPKGSSEALRPWSCNCNTAHVRRRSSGLAPLEHDLIFIY